jgi:hypothetical protein
MLNIGLVLLSLRGGYMMMAPERLHRDNPDGVLCLILLVIMPLFVLGAVAYSIYRWKCNVLLCPSWDRFPLNWWGDPLQSLFISTWNTAAITLGAIARLPIDKSADYRTIAFWMVASFGSITIGLLIGQFFAYRIFRNRIVAA